MRTNQREESGWMPRCPGAWMVLPLTERDKQGAVWGGLGSSKDMRLETQIEFQVPVPCQRAAQPQKATDPLTSNDR